METLMHIGRPLATAGLLVLLIISFLSEKKWNISIPRIVMFVLLVQVVLVIKVLSGGSMEFAFLS